MLHNYCILLFQHVLFLINLLSSKTGCCNDIKYYDALINNIFVSFAQKKIKSICFVGFIHLFNVTTQRAFVGCVVMCFDRLINIFICLCSFYLRRIGFLHWTQILSVRCFKCVHCRIGHHARCKDKSTVYLNTDAIYVQHLRILKLFIPSRLLTKQYIIFRFISNYVISDV